MHVGQLRKEFDDILFTRTGSGLAFTPGGLRLASRAVEILGLQDRTVREVSQAGRRPAGAADGRLPPVRRARRPRADRAVRRPCRRPRGGAERAPGRSSSPACSPPARSTWRSGRRPARRPTDVVQQPVPEVRGAGGRPPGPPAGRTARRPPDQLRSQQLAPRPGRRGHRRRRAAHAASTSACPRRTSGSSRATPPPSRRPSAVPAVALAVRFAVAGDLAAGGLVPLDGPHLRAQGRWSALALPAAQPDPGRGRAAPLHHHAAGDPGDGARRRRAPGPVQAGGARHPLELTRGDRVEHLGQRPQGVGGQERVAVGQRRRHRAHPRLEAGGRRARVQPDHASRAPAQPGHDRSQLLGGSSESHPSEAITSTPPRTRVPVPRGQQLAQAGGEVGAAEPVHDPFLGQRHRLLGGPVRQRRGEPGERGRERERLRAPGPGEARIRWRYAVEWLCIDWLTSATSVIGHRPADGVVVLEQHRLPAGAAGRGDGGPQRDRATRRTHLGAPAAPGRPAVRRLLEPAAEQPELVAGRARRGGCPRSGRRRWASARGAPGRPRAPPPRRCAAGCARAARRPPRPRPARRPRSARRRRPRPAGPRRCGGRAGRRPAAHRRTRRRRRVEHGEVLLTLDQGDPGQPVELGHAGRVAGLERVAERGQRA